MLKPVLCALVACSALAGALGASSVATQALPRLHGEDLDTVVRHSDGVWMIAVTSAAQCGEPCDAVHDTLEAVHERAADVISLAEIDAFEMVTGKDGETREVREEFNITALPAALLYTYGPKVTMQGFKIEANIVMALLGQGPKTFMKNIKQFIPSKSDVVKKFGVEKFLTYSEPELPRALLIHSKKAAPITWNRMSLQFDRRAVFGEIPAPKADEDFLARFGVTKDDLPALLISPPAVDVDAEAETFEWTRYSGESMKYGPVSQWLHSKLPEVPMPEIKTKEDFNAYCTNKGGVCFIAFMPDDEDDRDDFLARYRYVASRAYSTPNMDGGRFVVNNLPVHFAWINGHTQKPIMENFGITSPPGVVGVNPRKQKYSAFMGAFEPDSVHDFILDMMESRASISSYDEFPDFRLPAPKPKKAKKAAKASKKKDEKTTKKKKKKDGKKKKKKGGSSKKKKAEGSEEL